MENVFQKIREERAAWYEAYKSATPEEQKRMLEEKKAKYEEEEKRRKQMIEDDRKARFFKKTDEQIACYELLKKAMPIALEVAASFDGKILNNRLTNAVNERLHKEVDRYVTAKLVISYNWNLSTNVGELKVTDYNHHDCWNEDSFKIILSNTLGDSGRVMWQKSLEYMEQPGEKSTDFSERIATRKKAKKDYDKVLKQARKVDEIIREYCQVDYELRDFFRTEYIIGNTSSI